MKDYFVKFYTECKIEIGAEEIKVAEKQTISISLHDLWNVMEQAHMRKIKICVYEANLICDMS